MKHYIIVKFKEGIKKENIIEPIKKLFNNALEINQINKIDFYISNSKLLNRYDVMIKMDLSLLALNEFDNSEIHKRWKDEFGKYIINKTIFDCD